METLLLAAATCALLSTPDEQAYCRAMQQQNPARCQEISNEALRMQCRAALGDDEAVCNGLLTEDRERCRARAKSN